MEDVILALEPRDLATKAKHVRRDGRVPAVIHDHGKPSVHVSGVYLEVLKAYKQAGKHHPVKLKAGDKNYVALIKFIDIDPKRHELVHVVFNAIKANEKVTAEIPVRAKLEEGNDATPAERNGLVVLNQLENVEVEALAKDLPDVLEFDGEKLVEVGDQITVADIIVLSGVTIKADPTHPLATVFEPSALQAANDAAGGDATEDEAVADVDAGEAAEGLAAEKSAEASQAAGDAKDAKDEGKKDS
ncbi:MAG TPA: 50S ribosomal protein L25 [Candidatus Saccharimonadales bacterium]|nr:50S ribosomal protein L25 [Candidatus Saccharimonadales bacterium]